MVGLKVREVEVDEDDGGDGGVFVVVKQLPNGARAVNEKIEVSS